ncbi:uncharacterized protein BDZ99DRAFT_304475 [Mytilinidion resinicola]|uniref:Uncharacterized protein n=1 Tax=Mytilinidion resinicola TaxID=574789 RepID=A0A6A6YMU5_9PEZI|nr:uncharacterized protein BDZ99DRAFT_304475 [Mytilinidion resinicola]KAF2810110.1 hypothetical protein BDZ99DRAFT_304475 [Mytilinidion resinicola]
MCRSACMRSAMRRERYIALRRMSLERDSTPVGSPLLTLSWGLWCMSQGTNSSGSRYFQSNDHHRCGGALATTADAAIRRYEAGSIGSVHRIVRGREEEAALDGGSFVSSDAIFAGLRLAHPWESRLRQEPPGRAAPDKCHRVLLARRGDEMAAEVPSRPAWASTAS